MKYTNRCCYSYKASSSGFEKMINHILILLIMMKATIYTPSLRHKLAAALHTLASVPAMLATLALPLALSTSCATEELVDPATPTPGQQVTITASLGSDNGNSKPGTRMGYEPDDAGTGLKTTWTAGDAFNIVPVNSGSEGIFQPFTLAAASIGKSEGTFSGTAPANSSEYVIYHPKTITSSGKFESFPYAGQVQAGNDNRNHLTGYHSIKKTILNYTTGIDFTADVTQSSCMKFVLTPGAAITPTKITLASEDGSECFYSNNNTDALVSSLSLGLNEFCTSAASGTITAYMMMSCQTVTLPNAGIIVTVYAEDGSSYTQTITPASSTTLESGKMHTITAKNMTKVELPSMTFTVKVDADLGLDFNIPFPTSGTTPAKITVDWGDGSETVSVPAGTTLTVDDAFKHEYSTAGTYTITITSSQTDETKQQMPDFDFRNNRNNNNNNAKKLSSLDSPLLNTGATDFSSCFSGCTGLTAIPEGLFDKNTQVNSFNYCFTGCTALTTIPTSLFDKNTEVTSFSGCFTDCTGLTTIPTSLFDKNTEVTSFSSCFSGCTGLTAIPEGLFDKNTEVTSFGTCFSYCTGLTTIPTGLFDKNTQVTSFSYCFTGCRALTAIPTGLFDNNTQVTSFNYCFDGCTALTAIPTGLFDKNTQVTNFNYCFSGCTALAEIPAGLFDNNTQVTNFSYCFYNCKALAAIPADLFDKNTEVTNFSYCFYNCTALAAIPAGLFDKNTEVTNFSYCFYDCTALAAIPAGLFDNNTQVTNFNYCFSGCTALAAIPADLFDKNTEVTNFSYCFYDCTALAAIPAGLFDNNTQVTNFNYCFSGCTSLVLNETIFSAKPNPEERKNRFSGKAMKFSKCFQNTGSALTPKQQEESKVPQLWNYDRGAATWTTTDCYNNCKASNFTDDFPASGWGTPAPAPAPDKGSSLGDRDNVNW